MNAWEVAAAADAVVAAVPLEQVRQLVEVMESGSAAAVRHKVNGLGPTARPLVSTLLSLGGPTDVAVPLATAAMTGQRCEDSFESIKVVWTGRPTVAVESRPTSEVIKELITTARKRLTLATYSAGDVSELVQLLHERKKGGVDVRLLLETPGPTGWGPDSLKDFAALTPYVETLLWPRQLRKPPSDYTQMHIKVVIRDDDAVLVTSANLSKAAMDRNMELGVLIKGRLTAERLQRHIDELVEIGVLDVQRGQITTR